MRLARPRRRWQRLRLYAAPALLLGFALIQAVPYGRSRADPPVRAEPAWDSPATPALAEDACFDCRSNETTWPWYSNVAAVSWLVQNDVDGGRSTLDFSEWNRPQDGAGDVVEAVLGKSMPPWYYALLHSKAKLSRAERERLARGLGRTVGTSPPRAAGGG